MNRLMQDYADVAAKRSSAALWLLQTSPMCGDLSQALDDAANGGDMNASLQDARMLAEVMLPDPSHHMAPFILQAAQETIPQFNHAVDTLPAIEPPARDQGEPID